MNSDGYLHLFSKFDSNLVLYEHFFTKDFGEIKK